MPARSDDPLRRVTLNLYESDCQWLEKTYGHGWTERVRQHIHSEVLKRYEEDKQSKAITRITLAKIASGYEHKDPMWPDDLGDDVDDFD